MTGIRELLVPFFVVPLVELSWYRKAGVQKTAFPTIQTEKRSKNGEKIID